MSIYALHILDRKFVKIGYTVDPTPERRIAELQTGSPFKLFPIICVDGTLRQEQALHAALTVAFGRIRIPVPPNEWYPGRHPIMRDLVASLSLGAGQALALLGQYDPAVKQPGQKKGGHFDPLKKWGATAN